MKTTAPTPPIRPVLILHTGDPETPVRQRHGSYADMLRQAAGLKREAVEVVAVHLGEQPAAPALYRAVLITGSPAMVTDRAPWSEAAAVWLRTAAAAGLPIFGICYGHQLLAHALGGEVGYLPKSELGTQEVQRRVAGDDALVADLPERFDAHMLHAQSVLRLPPRTVVLASSAQDPHQLLRFAPGVYSSQFHPEFDQAFMSTHLQHHSAHYARAGHDPQALVSGLRPAPQAAGLLQRFLALHA